MALALPLLVLLLASTHVIGFTLALLLVPLSVLVTAVLYAQWVPLTRWDISNPQAVAQGVARHAAPEQRATREIS